MVSLDRPIPMETPSSRKKATHSHSHAHVYSQMYPKNTPSFCLSPTSASVHPSSSSRPKPVVRTVSSASNLHLKTGNLRPAEDELQLQPPSQSISTSGIPSPAFPTLSSSSSFPVSTLLPSSPPPSSSPLPSSTNTQPDPQQHHQQRKQYQRTQQSTEERPMNRTDQGRHVQEKIAVFSRLMIDNKTDSKSSVVVPLLAITTPPASLSVPGPSLVPATVPVHISPQGSHPSSFSPPSSGSSASSSTSPSFTLTECSSSAMLYTAPKTAAASMTSTSAATATTTGQPPLLISQPIMPMSVIPAAIMGIKSTPSYVSLGVINGAVAGPSTTMSTSLLPLVGCDYLNYSSLNDTLTTGAVVAETKPRPLSSMEYAESWLPTATPSTDAPECNLARQNAAYCSSLPENNDPHCVKDTDRVDSIKTVTTLPSNQQSIHPLELHPDQSTNPILLELGQSKEVQAQAQPQQQQPVLRKKSSFAAKLRNVFISKQGTSKDAIETREDILSVSFKDDGKTGTLYVGGLSASLANQHRGSVSSNSSTDTTSGPNGFRRGSGQTTTPSTSPETSPLNSPTVKTCPTLIVPGQQQPSISSLSALDAESETDAEDREPTGFSKEETTLGTNGIYSTPTRAVKKRLSFASISSFFASRNLQERRAKQSRSSSVPHVESRLVVAGRQITEFQRRHSLNDLRDSGTKAKDNRSMNHSTTPPWDRDRATSQVSPAPSHSTPTIPAPTKKLSLNNVFNKQIKRRNKTTHVPAPAPSAAKPLKSALAHRPPVSASPRLHHVHTASRRRSASIRSQSSSQHRRHYHNHQQQRHSAHHSSATEDPFIRLAQANHALATLNKKGSRGSESQIKDSYLFETQDPPYEAPGSLLKDTPQRITHLTSRDTAPFGSCTPSTPPTPRVLPVSTSKVAPSASADRCQSPPQNSLATLSRPSSCCSLESAYEGANTSSSASDDSSFSSSFSAHYEASGASRSRQQGVRRTSTGQAINTLLPTSAARVSVDNIAMETQVKRSTAGGVRKDDLGNFLTPESYSTMSNSSTAASSTSSPSTKVSMHLEEHRLAGVGGTAYHHLRCQQQLLAREPYDPHPMHEYYAEHEKEHDHLAQDHHLRHHYLDELEPQHQHYHHGERGYYYTDPSFYQARPRRQIQFSTEEPTVYPTWTPEQYDRTADTSITASCLTPAIAQKIKLELNHFKSQEMKVHQDSRIYTHFFV